MWIVPLLCALLCLGASNGQTADMMNFFVLGDFGGVGIYPYTTPYQVGNAHAMGNATDLNAQFVIALGDNFYWNGVENVDDRRFQQTFEHVYTAENLYIPWYLVAGNHDHDGNVTAQIAYTQVSERWNFPSLYYKVQKQIPGGATMDIILFDRTTLCSAAIQELRGCRTFDEQYAEDQWLWLDFQMRTSTADYLIVGSHYPVWSVGEHGPTACLVDRLMPMLHQYNVSVYIAGHEHNHQHLVTEYNGTLVNYVVTGVADSVNPPLDNLDAVPPGSLQFLWREVLSFGGHVQVYTTSEKQEWVFIQAMLEGGYEELYRFEVLPRVFA